MEFSLSDFLSVQEDRTILVRVLVTGIIIIASSAALRFVRAIYQKTKTIDQQVGEMSSSRDTSGARADDINRAVTQLLDR